MFSEKDLALIERTVDACECWCGVKWEKAKLHNAPDDTLLFSLTPCTRRYDARTEIYASNLTEFIREVKNQYESYDPDEEASLWIGPDGHGTNGAPYHIREILDDMEELEKAYEELAIAFDRLR